VIQSFFFLGLKITCITIVVFNIYVIKNDTGYLFVRITGVIEVNVAHVIEYFNPIG